VWSGPEHVIGIPNRDMEKWINGEAYQSSGVFISFVQHIDAPVTA
jgi:hypothetical protein